MKKHNYKNDWEEFAELDSRWAVLSLPGRERNNWDEKEFFKTGQVEADDTIELLRSFEDEINFDKALDFGCGVGRITRGLKKYYKKVYGVDVSKKMIADAKGINKDKNIIFVQNVENNLSCFEDNKFDFVYSAITLQHIPDKDQIKKYIKEFYRIIKPGAFLYFQLPRVPNYSWQKEKLLKFRSALYRLFTNRLKFSKQFCYQNLLL